MKSTKSLNAHRAKKRDKNKTEQTQRKRHTNLTGTKRKTNMKLKLTKHMRVHKNNRQIFTLTETFMAHHKTNHPGEGQGAQNS